MKYTVVITRLHHLMSLISVIFAFTRKTIENNNLGGSSDVEKIETGTPTKTKPPRSFGKKSLGSIIRPVSQIDLVNSTKSAKKKVVIIYCGKD